MHLGWISDVDGLAMTMVVILTLSFSVVALLLWTIVRNGKQQDREVEELLEELRKSQEPRKITSPTAPTAPPETREPWEKESDWWKK